MSLIDTNVVSEARKGPRANPGVRRFFDQAVGSDWSLYLSVLSRNPLARMALRPAGELHFASISNSKGRPHA